MFGKRRRPDNEWLRQDQRERRKTIAAVVLFATVAASALGLLIWGIAAH